MDGTAEGATTTTTTTTTEGGLPRDHPLFGYVPETFELQRERSAGPMLYYLHEPSGRHMAIAPGGGQGRIIGAIVWWRHGEDSMNMEAEAPFETLKFTLRFVESQITEACRYSEHKFRDNLLMHLLNNKKGFAIGDGETPSRPLFELRRIPPDSCNKRGPIAGEDEHGGRHEKSSRIHETQDGSDPGPSDQPGEAPRSPRLEPTDEEANPAEDDTSSAQREEPMATEEQIDEDSGLCMICMERMADTVVIPCMHRVVCAACSLGLQNTADRAVCCMCRRPIDAVSYPDNSLLTTE
jgi:hypothetical protein